MSRALMIEAAAREGMKFWDGKGEEVRDLSDLPFLTETAAGKFSAISAALLTQRNLDIKEDFMVKDLLATVAVWAGLRAVQRVNEKIGAIRSINLTDKTIVTLVVDKPDFFKDKIHFFIEDFKQGFTVHGLINLPGGELEPGLPDKVVVLKGNRSGEPNRFTVDGVTKSIGLEIGDVCDVNEGKFTEEGQRLIDFIADTMLEFVPAEA